MSIEYLREHKMILCSSFASCLLAQNNKLYVVCKVFLNSTMVLMVMRLAVVVVVAHDSSTHVPWSPHGATHW